MSLPNSFLREGFIPAKQARVRRRLPNGKFLKPLLIGTEGETNTGKTEFILSCPGPGIMLALDRNFDGMLDNPNPPADRHVDDWAIKVIQEPLNTTATQKVYGSYFTTTRQAFYDALDNPDSVSIAIDCDSDFWELQRLTDFGKLANVWPQTRYGDTYAAKRAMIARAWDSGKIVIGTNKVRDEFETVYKPDGTPEMESDGKTERRRKTGNKTRQGFPDTDYLWQIQLRHLFRPASVNKVTGSEYPQAWGIRIIKCKPNPQLQGEELWGEDCCFRGLVELVYPNVSMEEWNLR